MLDGTCFAWAVLARNRYCCILVKPLFGREGTAYLVLRGVLDAGKRVAVIVIPGCLLQGQADMVLRDLAYPDARVDFQFLTVYLLLN